MYRLNTTRTKQGFEHRIVVRMPIDQPWNEVALLCLLISKIPKLQPHMLRYSRAQRFNKGRRSLTVVICDVDIGERRPVRRIYESK